MFQRACVVGCLDLVQYMDKNGADLSICNAYGDSPVYLAAYAVVSNKNPNFETLQYLIDAGMENCWQLDRSTIVDDVYDDELFFRLSSECTKM